MKSNTIFAAAFAASAIFGSSALAQDPVEMLDVNANYSMQIGGGIAWDVESDLSGLQSTVVAASPEGYEPFTTVSAMTYLEKNALALIGASIAEKTTDGFLEGLCDNYKCTDISDRTYQDIDGRMAWVAVTSLELPSYHNLGIPDAVMVATVSPEGFMQLFSLHTAEGRAEEQMSILIEAIKTISPVTP